MAAISWAAAVAIALLAGSPSPASAVGGSQALLPQPVSLQRHDGSLARTPMRIAWRSARTPYLDRALARFQHDMERLQGQAPATLSGFPLTIDCAQGDGRLQGADEHYTLTIAPEGVTLAAPQAAGVLHGLATLRQVIATRSASEPLPALTIEDAPRFAWRGVMIDTSRHFVSVATLKRQIDAMEAVKLNVLHLHLSDNEGFRVESLRYPKLQAIASHGQFYTQAQIHDVVAYAADRGVRIVPEIDVPAHTAAILLAYPELGGVGPDPSKPFAAYDQALDPTSERVYRFLDGLLGEMAALFPDSRFHLGGDETPAGVWTRDPRIKAAMAAKGFATQDALQAAFSRRVRAILAKHGKTMIGWEEVAAGGLPKDVIVQAWRTSNGVADAVRLGHRTIVSAGYYLDQLIPAASHYRIDPYDVVADGFTPEEGERARKASPLAAAAVDPLVLKPLAPLTPAEQALVLGGEGPLWAELVSDEMVDDRLWPRAAALAERFWSPASVRDADDMLARAALVQDELRRLGLDEVAARQRMAARLAPGGAEAVLTLLSAVAPIRHATHNHAILASIRGKTLPTPQSLTELADAAPVDGMAVRRFEAGARRAAQGDRAPLGALRAQLVAWRDNDARFVDVARGRPLLEAALPTSKAVAELATSGIEALQAMESGAPPPADALARARERLTKSETYAAASERPVFAFMRAQPPADLIVAIAPGVRLLVEAAARSGRPAPAAGL